MVEKRAADVFCSVKDEQKEDIHKRNHTSRCFFAKEKGAREVTKIILLIMISIIDNIIMVDQVNYL